MIAAIVLVVIFGYIYLGKKTPVAQDSTVVKTGNVVQTVSVTGTVKPVQDVSLAFEASGRVQSIYANVGDKVSAGQLLVELDTSELAAQLAKAQADLDSQQSELDQAQVVLTNDYSGSVDVLNDAYTKANDAIRNQTDILFSNPDTSPRLIFTVSNSQDQINMESQRPLIGKTLNDWLQVLSGLTASSSQDVLTQTLVDGGSRLVLVRNFLDLAAKSITDSTGLSQTTITTYKANINTGRAEVNTALSNVNGKIQDINAQIATISTDQAGIKSYGASIDNIKAQISKKSLYSPIYGVVTQQDAKVGEIAAANVNVVSVISSSQFDIEAYVPEADIAKLKIGNSANVTLDAYGSDVVFRAKVVKIDPGENVIEGVPTYKTTLEFTKEDERVKSGMTANIDILTAEKDNVLFVPQRSVATKINGDKYVLVEIGQNKTEERKVETGLRGSDGNIEITSGLKEGDAVATFAE